MVKTVSPVEIREIGFEALTKELGVVGAIRFMQQYDRGRGDYTKEREKLYNDMTVDELFEASAKWKESETSARYN